MATSDNHEVPPVNQDKAVRDARGRFVPGNPGGPGNPYGAKDAALRRAFLNAVTPEQVERIARKLLELAEAGNVEAANVLMSLRAGYPAIATADSKRP